MRLVLADILEPGFQAGECGHVQRRRQICVRDLVQLQLEEQEIGGHCGQFLLGVAVELGARRIGHVAVEAQARVGTDAADHVHQFFKGFDGRRECPTIGTHRHELALVAGLQAPRFVSHEDKVTLELRRVGSGIEVRQVPFGHGSEGWKRLHVGLRCRRRV